MRKSKILMLVLICIIVASTMVGLVGCGPKNTADWVDTSDLDVKLWDDYYIGTKVVANGAVTTGGVDLTKAFPDATVTVTAGVGGVIAGNILTASEGADFKISVASKGETKTYNAKGIDAVNVTSAQDMRKVFELDKPKFEGDTDESTWKKYAIAVQSDFAMDKGEGFNLRNDFYGNGHFVNLEELVKSPKKKERGYGFMTVRGKDIVIRDLKVSGKVFEKKAKNDQVGLTSLEYTGGFFTVEAVSEEEKSSVDFINCVFENGQKMIYITSSDVRVEGCVFRNSCDNGLCIETVSHKQGGANVTVKNSVMVNEVVAGILSCGWNDTTDYTTINIEGFLDIYNWKDSANAKLMPSTESAAGIVNNLVKSEAKKDKFTKKLYVEGEKFYMHAGIIILATGSFKGNKAIVNGADAVGFKKMDFPLPGAAKTIAKTCEIIGYTNTSSAGFKGIKPLDKFSANNYYEALKTGVKPATK